ncbi:DUF1993 family protein [Methylocapsa sp. S129]|uniref:DUF1993 domain-containing protein n=1 Tax=Methylocapsa sp. S129 TaxID=1641869 RepID=UPI00131A8FEF|nr:DUF1993 domain-containing protein [Methylocapsa sp. S129]
MSTLLYQATVPVFVQTLGALDAIIDKAAAHATAQKIDPAVLLASRLRPDMLPFVRQTQIVCDNAKNMAGRLAGAEIPRFEDNEASFDDIKARIKKTLDYIGGVNSQDIEAGENREIVFPIGPNKMKMKGADYIFHFALPNFYFHLTTAYGILRHNGVELGKRDFLGAVVGVSPA